MHGLSDRFMHATVRARTRGPSYACIVRIYRGRFVLVQVQGALVLWFFNFCYE